MPRLRRDLRTALLWLLLGIAIGATALSRNNNGDDEGPRGVSSVSVASEEPRETGLGYDSPQAVGIEKLVNKENTSKPATAEANSENRKTHATTTCEGNNSGCPNVPLPAGMPGGTQMPATFGTTLATASALFEAASEHSVSKERAGDPPSNPLVDKNSSKTARNPPRPRHYAPNYREERAAISRGYDKPAEERGRAYSLNRSFGHKGFWDWSR